MSTVKGFLDKRFFQLPLLLVQELFPRSLAYQLDPIASNTLHSPTGSHPQTMSLNHY